MSDTQQLSPKRSLFSALRTTLKPLQTPWTLVVLIPLVVLALDQEQASGVVTDAARSLLSTLPYIVFAVLLIATLKAAGAETAIARVFQGNQSRMIVMAALFGGLAPFCSCEVIPFISALLILGAPLSSVMAFWLSSPLIDPPTLIITSAALGWPFALAKAVAAVGIGLLGGFAMQGLLRAGLFADPLRAAPSQGCGCGPSPLDGRPVWRFWTQADRRRTFGSETVANGLFLLKWLALAYVLQAVLMRYIPAEAIAGVVGGEGLLPIIIAALVGMPAYLNSYVAPPLLAGLTEQGMSAGAAMAFMVAGGISSIPAMAAVWSLVKRPVFTAYIALGVTGAILSGALFGTVYGVI